MREAAIALYAIHGFSHFLDRPFREADKRALYSRWSEMLARPVIPFSWPAQPSFLAVLLYDYRHRYRDRVRSTYELAWERAEEAGKKLGNSAEPGSDIIAHSLGTRVALEACRHQTFRRVLLLHGSEYVPTAVQVAKVRPLTAFINACSDEDWVLQELGYRYGPGLPGDQRDVREVPVIGRTKHALKIGLPNWKNVPIIGADHWGYRQHGDMWRKLMEDT